MPSPVAAHESMLEHMRSIVAGDREALFELYDQSSGLVLRTAQRILGVGLDADEVVLETYENIWLRRDQFDAARGTPLSWILTIARSRALDRRRSDLVRKRREEDAPGELGERAVESPADELVRRERSDRLEQALLSLTPVQRRFIELAFYLGASHSEIAKLERTPLGTVKSTIRRGLLSLRNEVPSLESLTS